MRKLNIHYFQHVHFEGLGSIEDWAKSEGHHLTSTKFYQHATLPRLEDIDWLVIMGGPMGVFDDAIYPWLAPEKKFIEHAIKQNKTVIGVCLGSQLIADVLGAKVYRSEQKEIGWFPVQLTEQGKENEIFSFLPREFSAFHWHGETFDLPQNAIHVAQTAVCQNQAFIYDDAVIGLQFHLEVTEQSISKMVHFGRADLVQSAYIQDEKEILSGKQFVRVNNEKLNEILNRIKKIRFHP